MQIRAFHWRAIILLGLAGYAIGVAVLTLASSAQPTYAGLLQVHFLDVGQGDAILIITSEGNQVLVDGGPDSQVLSHLTEFLPWSDRTIEVVVGTHPDLDHVTGLVDVLTSYQVPTIITTEAEGASPAAKAWVAGVGEEGAAIHYARAGQVYALGASTTLTVLSPSYDPTKLNSNTGSIVALLEYGDIQFLLTGDAPQGVEQYLADTHGAGLAAEVLKLGHHGSDTSTSGYFLETVAPDFAVVSAGLDNRYNHPDPDVLARVEVHTEAAIVSTQHGTVSFVSDGTDVWLTQ
jgi:competence protein ComEC